jgi:hypothetical protein
MRRDRFDQVFGDWRWDDIAVAALFVGYWALWALGLV